MNLELTDEQVALRDTVRRYLAEKASLATYVRPLLDDAVTGADEVWRGLAAMGVTGLLVPETCDGAGMTMVEAGVVAEELGAALYPGPWLSTAVAATRALVRTGADENAAGLLTAIAEGSAIATVGPLAGPRPTAIDGATLRGTVTGRSRRRRRRRRPSVRRRERRRRVVLRRHIVGGRGDDAVPPCRPDTHAGGSRIRRCARATDSHRQRNRAISAVVDDVVIAYAADALGAATAVMNLAIEYAKVRKQFDQPIGSFQAVQHLCVDMYEATELARSGVIHALWAADAAEPAEHHLAALRAKAFAGRLTKVGDTAIQVFGGIGFTWEHDAHLYLKRLLGWSGFLGSSDRYLEEVGRGLQ